MRSLSRLISPRACLFALLVACTHCFAADAPPPDIKGKVVQKWQSLGPCAKGAIAGGVAGQVLGGHAVVGALAGCGGAKVLAAKKQADAKAQQPAEVPKPPQRSGEGTSPSPPAPQDPQPPQIEAPTAPEPDSRPTTPEPDAGPGSQ